MDSTRENVRKRYGEIARKVTAGGAKSSCCSSSCCSPGTDAAAKDAISTDLYSGQELAELPLEAYLASLGCGNPTALAQLSPGETVLDLGSGGGIDVLLSARRVGPEGFAYGLDMTDDMLQLAELNQLAAGVTNVKFLKGTIEHIPLPDCSVDVIISNCVINLSADKDRVLSEAFRVLKPGGRFAVSDMVIDGEMPESLKADVEAWSGCVAGALSVDDYRAKLASAGFADVDVAATRIHRIGDMLASGFEALRKLSEAEQQMIDGRLWSAFIRARKP
jgi:arsenite methyltransferase